MEYIVTLVHGTFARHAKWTFEQSNLCQTLRTSLDNRVLFKRFEWSGRNSLSARLAAARRLRSELSQSFTEHPTAKHYVIGHSHGGYIALRALRGPNWTTLESANLADRAFKESLDSGTREFDSGPITADNIADSAWWERWNRRRTTWIDLYKRADPDPIADRISGVVCLSTPFLHVRRRHSRA